MVTKEVKKIGDKFIGTRSLITDKLKANNSTESILFSIELDIPLDDKIFSLSYNFV